MLNDKIIYRVDGGKKLGYGHLYRAIELSKLLIDSFKIIIVIKKDKSGHNYLRKKIRKGILIKKKKSLKGLLDDNVKGVIFDTTFLLKKELILIKKKKIKIIVLEDFKNISKNYANLIINAIVSGSKNKIINIKNGKEYLGSKYKVFKNNIEDYKRTESKKKNLITISLGGGEVYEGEILKLIKTLYPILVQFKLNINLILGNGVSDKTFIKLKKLPYKIKIFKNLNNIFSILSKSLFVICGGGGTAYEAAYFNCVTFFISRVKHQEKNINYFIKNKYGRKIPYQGKKKELLVFFNKYLLNKKFITQQQKISKKIISSNGVSNVIKLIKNKINEK